MPSCLRLETKFHDLREGLAILRRLSFRVHIWGPGLAWYGSTLLRTHHFVRTTSVSRRSGPFSQRIRTCSLFDPAGCASAKSYDVHSRPETQSLVRFRLQSRLQQPIAIQYRLVECHGPASRQPPKRVSAPTSIILPWPHYLLPSLFPTVPDPLIARHGGFRRDRRDMASRILRILSTAEQLQADSI